MTYARLFENALAERLTGGGPLDEILRLARIYQGTDPHERAQAFTEWLRTASPDCSRCQARFRPPTKDVREDMEPLCLWCSASHVRFGPEPVPGWQRTWQR